MVLSENQFFFPAGCQEFEKTNQTSNYHVKEEKPRAFNLKKNTDYRLNPELRNLNLGLFMFSQQEF